MSKTTKASRPQRRAFFKQASVAVGALGAAAVAGPAAAAVATPEDRSGRGYRETEHVRTYYDLARF